MSWKYTVESKDFSDSWIEELVTESWSEAVEKFDRLQPEGHALRLTLSMR